MSFSENVEELLACLRKLEQKSFSVVVMPDFFLDRLVAFEGNVKKLYSVVAEIADRKGGSINGVKQMELRGGNAANTAAALAALGVKVYPIISTSQLGFQLLRFYLKPLGVDLSHVKTRNRTSITTALELVHGDGKVNVMLRDVGSLAEFSPEDLNIKDFELLKKADYVCVFNWAGTRCHGTKLAQEVFSHVKKRGQGKTYYDTADPTPNKERISQLIEKVLLSNLIDIFSVNESEAICYASHLSNEVTKLKKALKPEELAKKCAEILAENMSARVDLHTTTFACSFTKNSRTIVPTFRVSVLRSTGAGDVWNAGNIFADAHGFSDVCRLTFANAVSAYYISNPKAEHPTLEEIVRFLEQQKR